MKKQTKRSRDPIGKIKIIKDFLPPPENLIFKERSVVISLSLPESSVAYFKKEAKKRRVPYESMLSNLLQKVAQKELSL